MPTSASCSLPSLLESHSLKACAAARLANQRKRPMTARCHRRTLRSGAVAKQGVQVGSDVGGKPVAYASASDAVLMRNRCLDHRL